MSLDDITALEEVYAALPTGARLTIVCDDSPKTPWQWEVRVDTADDRHIVGASTRTLAEACYYVSKGLWQLDTPAVTGEEGER